MEKITKKDICQIQLIFLGHQNFGAPQWSMGTRVWCSYILFWTQEAWWLEIQKKITKLHIRDWCGYLEVHWCNRNCSPQITTIPQSRLPNLRPEIYAHIGLGSPLKHCLTSSGNACRTTTCRLCEYQCCVLGNIALQSIVVGLAAC